jgi:hypothetical protein
MPMKKNTYPFAPWALCLLLLGFISWQHLEGRQEINSLKKVLTVAYHQQYQWQQAMPDSLWFGQTPSTLRKKWLTMHQKTQVLSHQLKENRLEFAAWKKKRRQEVKAHEAMILSQNQDVMRFEKEHDSLYSAWLKEKQQLIQQQKYMEAKLTETNLDTLSLTTSTGIKFLYFGKLKGGEPTGKGLAQYVQRGWYFGEWKEKKRHGQGTHHYKDGDVYQGSFVMDLREGYGVYLYKDGSRYEGQWEKDRMHGSGVYWTADGKKWEGIWEKGKKLDPST